MNHHKSLKFIVCCLRVGFLVIHCFLRHFWKKFPPVAHKTLLFVWRKPLLEKQIWTDPQTETEDSLCYLMHLCQKSYIWSTPVVPVVPLAESWCGTCLWDISKLLKTSVAMCWGWWEASWVWTGRTSTRWAIPPRLFIYSRHSFWQVKGGFFLSWHWFRTDVYKFRSLTAG